MINDVSTRRRPGRPRRPSEEGARIQQSLRMRPSINEEIREAAERNFRSISEELESRIDNSCECIVVSTKDGVLHAKIEEAAKRNCRSVEMEAKLRLQNSFVIEDILGDAQNSALLMLIASDLIAYGNDTGKKWYEAFDPKSSIIASDIESTLVNIVRDRMEALIKAIGQRKERADSYRRAVVEQEQHDYHMSLFVL